MIPVTAFIWAMYATSLVQVLGTPVIAIAIVILFVERVFGFGIFDPARGGDVCSSSICFGFTRIRRSTS